MLNLNKKQFFVDFEFKKNHIFLIITSECENFDIYKKKIAR